MAVTVKTSQKPVAKTAVKAVKAPVVKAAAKPVVSPKKTQEGAATRSPKAVKAVTGEMMTLPLVTSLGVKAGTIEVPQAIFGAEIHKTLLNQAVRIYLANQREGSAHSKTRSEVHGSSRKIYKQKGTGNARHGTIRAPIFVKGGVAHGPRVHDFSLSLPKVMAQKALISALSQQAKAEKIIVMKGLADMELKTKNMASTLKTLSAARRTLIVTQKQDSTVTRISRNIEGVTTIPALDIHTYEVLRNGTIILDERALTELTTRLGGKNA